MKTTALALASALVLGTIPAAAQWLTQPVLLQPGWNAIHLFVTPSQTACDQALAAYPAIEGVWKYNRQIGNAEFAENPSIPLTPNDHWLVWLPRSNPQYFVRNLLHLQGDQSYLIKVATNAAPFLALIKGLPTWRPPSWIPNAANLYALPVDPEAPPSFTQMLQDTTEVISAPGLSSGIFSVGPDGREFQIRQTARTLVQPGTAYWFKCGQFTRLVLPLTVEGEIMDKWGIDFGRDLKETSLFLKNVTAATVITLTVRSLHSEPAPRGFPEVAGDVPLAYFVSDPANNQFGWRDFTGELVITLQPGESREFRVAVRRSAMRPYSPTGACGAAYQSFLDVSESPHGVRLLVPIAAESDQVHRAGLMSATDNLPEYHLHQGLWVGQATIDHVNRPVTGNPPPDSLWDPLLPRPTAQKLSYRLLVHVDAQGQAKLLQRVFLAWQNTNGTSTSTNAQYSLHANTASIPAATRDVYRISSVAFPLMDPVPLSGALDYALFGRVNLGYDDPVNPFKHAYHPDHDNLDEEFSAQRLPPNQESFDVTRDIVLNFFVTRQTESGAFVPPGPVLDFNGTNSSLTVTTGTNDIRLANAFTVMAWVRANAPAEGESYLFSAANGTNDALFLKLTGTSGRMSLGITTTAGTTQITTTNLFPTNQWIHVAAVNDGAGHGLIYWNAALVAQGSLPAVPNVPRPNIFFGRGPAPTDGFFSGRIYDLVLWGDARSANEVFGDMWLSWGDPAEDDHMLLYFQATEGQGESLSDVSGQDNSGQLQSVNWNTADALPTPFWGIGQTAGEYTETITGLRRAPILLRGTFQLQRITRNAVLN